MGESITLRHAEDYFRQIEDDTLTTELQQFITTEIEVGQSSQDLGKSLAEIEFRKSYGATIIGIIRGQERIVMPKADTKLVEGDKLIIIGTPESKKKIEEAFPI